MLVLTRKPLQEIVLPQIGLTLKLISVNGNQVKLGITAPTGVDIYREELWRAMCDKPVDARKIAPLLGEKKISVPTQEKPHAPPKRSRPRKPR